MHTQAQLDALQARSAPSAPSAPLKLPPIPPNWHPPAPLIPDRLVAVDAYLYAHDHVKYFSGWHPPLPTSYRIRNGQRIPNRIRTSTHRTNDYLKAAAWWLATNTGSPEDWQRSLRLCLSRLEWALKVAPSTPSTLRLRIINLIAAFESQLTTDEDPR